MAIAEHTPFARGVPETRRRYVRSPQPIHFPAFEEMPETNRHMELRTLLYRILKHELAAQATLGSDQFVYYDPTTAKKKLAPDVFAKLGVPHAPFRVWKTWHRGAPDVAVEIVSDSDEAEEDWDTKLERYHASGIAEVVRFDPDDGERPVRVWDHVDGDLVEREPPEDGVLECARLGLFWVVLPHPAFVRALRLARDREGRDLLPTPEEAEARARQEETRARVQAEQARDALAAEVAELRRMLDQQAKGKPKATGKGRAPAKKARTGKAAEKRRS